MSSSTLWWLAPLIVALILYPVWGLIPRGKEARQLKFRQAAREAGLLVQIPREKKPDGRIAVNMSSGRAEYCMALPIKVNGHWKASREAFESIQPTTYQPQPLLDEFFKTWLPEHDGQIEISQRGKQLVALWDEGGTDTSLQRIITLLNSLKEMA